MLAPNPSMEFESEILLTGNPDSGQKQRALDGRLRTWADLMFSESKVIIGTMVALMKMRAIPSLAVHDSLIVAQEHEEWTCAVLNSCYFHHLRVKPLIKVNKPPQRLSLDALEPIR